MRFLPTAVLSLFLLGTAGWTSPSHVTISRDATGAFHLMRDDQPFFVKGVGGSSELALVKSSGANSIRTWGIETLDEMVDGKPFLDRCQDLGIAVTAGIWLKHERQGFSYEDPKFLASQRAQVREAVRKYRDHPAILIWGLGNEMEGPTGDGSNPAVWKELNELAKIVKEEDPNHPVMTVIAGAHPTKISNILKYYPNIDILGVNAYAGASGVGAAVVGQGWKKPFMLTEFGPCGHWEVRKTSWGAPLEPSSWDKASTYYATYSLLMENAAKICLGSYVFLWGHKQEMTSTWYGMFLDSGEKLPSVDAMTKLWTGKWPEFRSPRIVSFKTELAEAAVAPGKTCTASVEAKDYQDLPLTFEWSVVAENTVLGVGGDAEPVPPSFPECIVSGTGATASIRTPSKPGAYRLFVTVRNGKGGASKDNVPFLVQ